MAVVKSMARQVLRHISQGTPERFWVHYVIALVTIIGLLLAIHVVNGSILDRSSTAANIIKTSSDQVLTGQDILLAAESAFLTDEPNFETLAKTVKRFETAHLNIISSDVWSYDLEAHYFSGPEPLHYLANDFIQLANELIRASPQQQQKTLKRLIDLFERDGLRSGLLNSTTMLEGQANAEIVRLTRLQRSLLVASAILLLIKMVFIFMPAQIIVRSNIRQLNQQGDVLRASEAALQNTNKKLKHLINHDALTDLPNRSYLVAYLSAAISDRSANELSVLFIGLDGFKSINDLAGHDYGDAVLITVAGMLQACVDDHHIVARVGGDEFVLVTDEPPNALADRVRASFEEPIDIGGRRIPMVMSIGHLRLTTEHQDPFVILADVGLALQCAKASGGNRVQSFSSSLREEIGIQQQLQIELSDAIKNGELEPWFQPQIQLSDGTLYGAEVLARWRHPTHGLLTPDKFLPVAERAGLMIDMDHSIWQSAMRFANSWQGANIWTPRISLNAAPNTIADPHLVERFLLALQRSGLDPVQVVVEVLETTLINSADDIAAINIDSLAECGVALELDDFGTGYASLSKLTQLPLTGIKLDRSLVAPLPDQDADSVVRAILALAAELGLHVVAEGVEELVQANHLQNCGCALAQGYGYARPMPPHEFEKWLIENAHQSLRAKEDTPLQALRA